MKIRARQGLYKRVIPANLRIRNTPIFTRKPGDFIGFTVIIKETLESGIDIQ